MEIAQESQNIINQIELNDFISFHSFSTSKYFVLFELIFFIEAFSLVSKFVFFIKFFLANLASQTYAVDFLNFGVVIDLS